MPNYIIKMSSILFLFRISISLTFYIWWNDIIVPSFYSFDIVSYSSLNKWNSWFEVLSCKFNIWACSSTGSIDCPFFFVSAISLSFFWYVFLISEFNAINFSLRYPISSVLKYLKFSVATLSSIIKICLWKT